MIKSTNKIIIAAMILALVLVVSFYKTSSAEESEVVLTWEANSFYPADYQGKAPVVLGSSVSVSATVVKNNKLADVSNLEIFWYLDGKFFKKGVGLNKVTFDVDKFKGDEYFLMVAIKMDGKRVEKGITIPVGSQELVIENPRPLNIVKLGERVELKTMPYFFNVNSLSDLSFFWSIDYTNKEEQRANRLVLDIGNSSSLKGTDILVTGSAVNENNPAESAIKNLKLKIR